jgi:Rod binding domain-containing protein
MHPVIAASLGSAASAPNSIPRGSPAKIAQCAKDFEGLLVAQMLRSAREAGGGGLTGEGGDENEANSTLVELGEQQLAQALANSGALGIGKIVTAGLVKNAD